MKVRSLCQTKDAVVLETSGRSYLFLGGLDLSHLRHYADDRTRGEGGYSGRTRFDLAFLDGCKLARVELVFVSAVEDFLLLPFLMRRCQLPPLVVCSRPVAQAGLLKAEQFMRELNSREEGLGCQYFEESEAFSQVFKAANFEFEGTCELFEEADLKRLRERVVQLNWGEKYRLQPVEVSLHSSGFGLGSSAVRVADLSTGASVLLLGKASKQTWKYCCPLQLPAADFLVLANQSFGLDYSSRLKALVDSLEERLLRKGFVMVRVEREGLLLQLLDILNSQLSSLCNFVLLCGTSIAPMVDEANKFVQYLREPFRKRIMTQPPQLPLEIKSDKVSVGSLAALLKEETFQPAAKYSNSLLCFVVEEHPKFGRLAQLARAVKALNPNQPICKINTTSYDPLPEEQHFPLVEGLSKEEAASLACKFQAVLSPVRLQTANYIRLQGLETVSLAANRRLLTCEEKQITSILGHRVGAVQFSGPVELKAGSLANSADVTVFPLDKKEAEKTRDWPGQLVAMLRKRGWAESGESKLGKAGTEVELVWSEGELDIRGRERWAVEEVEETVQQLLGCS